MSIRENKKIKPFLKWAGGKTQLVEEISSRYPMNIKNITKYAEPFIGGGAIFFDVLSKYSLKKIFINDINKELIITYSVIRNNIKALIFILKGLQEEYVHLDKEARKEYYNNIRERFNKLKVENSNSNDIEIASLFIFLNKTCFNGLYRVNKKGLFNVPMGDYKNPLICDEENLKEISFKLKNVEIYCGDYRELLDLIDDETFVYLDPPYRPITKTSKFVSYSEENFNDQNQKELFEFVNKIHKKNAKIILSNSDPKNINEDDNFFDELYKDYKIERVYAKRMINSKGNSRGEVKEIIISNF